MESFISQLETLWMTAQVSIIEKVREIGVESEDYDFKVIKTDAARSFNLDSSKWLACWLNIIRLTITSLY